MQYLIHIRDDLVLEAHIKADKPHIRQTRNCTGLSRWCALGSMAAEMVGVIVGDTDDEMEQAKARKEGLTAEHEAVLRAPERSRKKNAEPLRAREDVSCQTRSSPMHSDAS
jgi:hypothetical protein